MAEKSRSLAYRSAVRGHWRRGILLLLHRSETCRHTSDSRRPPVPTPHRMEREHLDKPRVQYKYEQRIRRQRLDDNGIVTRGANMRC